MLSLVKEKDLFGLILYNVQVQNRLFKIAQVPLTGIQGKYVCKNFVNLIFNPYVYFMKISRKFRTQNYYLFSYACKHQEDVSIECSPKYLTNSPRINNNIDRIQCGISNVEYNAKIPNVRRIAGGNETLPGSQPWSVSIRFLFIEKYLFKSK